MITFGPQLTYQRSRHSRLRKIEFRSFLKVLNAMTDPVDGLLERIRSSLNLGSEQLVYRQLSVNEEAKTTSSVLVARSYGWDKGYIWMEIHPGTICCHSNAVATGPMSSMARKEFSLTDPALEEQLLLTVQSIVSARSAT
jgi:hypothetical protein